MSIIKVGTGYRVRFAPVPLNYVRNGVVTPGELASALSLANFQVARGRRKRLFSKAFNPSDAPTNFATDKSTCRFAGRTSPGATRARLHVVAVPPNSSTSPVSGDIFLQLSQETGLTGAGTTTVPVTFYDNGDSTSVAPDDYHEFKEDFDIDGDQEYRWTIHVGNGFRVFSMTLYELGDETLDTDVTASAVDTVPIGVGQKILGSAISDAQDSLHTLWKRSAPSLITWSASAETGPGTGYTSTTFANIFDTSITSYTSSSPGFKAKTKYHHSLDSADVGVTMYAYAKVGSAGTCNVRFIGNGSTVIGTMAVTSTTNTWHTTTGVLDGDEDEYKLDIQIAGSGSVDVVVLAAGMFRHKT